LKNHKGNTDGGFTLIELMIVIVIVGVLASVAIPVFRGRINEAKWSEGKVMMGTVARAIRAYHGEKGPTGPPPQRASAPAPQGWALIPVTWQELS